MGLGFIFLLTVLQMGKGKMWLKLKIPHAGGEQPLHPAGLVKGMLDGDLERLKPGPYPATDSSYSLEQGELLPRE